MWSSLYAMCMCGVPSVDTHRRGRHNTCPSPVCSRTLSAQSSDSHSLGTTPSGRGTLQHIVTIIVTAETAGFYVAGYLVEERRRRPVI